MPYVMNLTSMLAKCTLVTLHAHLNVYLGLNYEEHISAASPALPSDV